MAGLIRGLAYGGASGLIWACVEGVAGGSLAAIPSTGFALIACGFLGGGLAELVPAERIAEWGLGRILGMLVAGAILWVCLLYTSDAADE